MLATRVTRTSLVTSHSNYSNYSNIEISSFMVHTLVFGRFLLFVTTLIRTSHYWGHVSACVAVTGSGVTWRLSAH